MPASPRGPFELPSHDGRPLLAAPHSKHRRRPADGARVGLTGRSRRRAGGEVSTWAPPAQRVIRVASRPNDLVRVAVVVLDLPVAPGLVHGPGWGLAVEADGSVAKTARRVLQGAQQGASQAASAKGRDHVHPLQLANAVTQGLDPAAAGDSAINRADDVRAGRRGEVLSSRRWSASQRTSGELVVLGQDGGDQIAGGRLGGITDPELSRHMLSFVHSDSQGGWPDASACASTEQCRDRPDRSSRPDLRQASVGRRLGATATATCRRSARPAPPTMAFAPAWRVAVRVGGKGDLAPQRRDGRSGMIWA